MVPHCWKTGIGIAASIHLSVTAPHCPYVEFLPASLSESPLRKELVKEEFRFVEGQIPLPQSPGLGIELDKGAIERFRADRQADF